MYIFKFSDFSHLFDFVCFLLLFFFDANKVEREKTFLFESQIVLIVQFQSQLELCFFKFDKFSKTWQSKNKKKPPKKRTIKYPRNRNINCEQSNKITHFNFLHFPTSLLFSQTHLFVKSTKNGESTMTQEVVQFQTNQNVESSFLFERKVWKLLDLR